jgi:hypothetical protein
MTNGESEIQRFMRTEGIPHLLARAKARRALKLARADADVRTVVRLDGDSSDPVAIALRAAEERLAVVGVRTDSEREAALTQLKYARQQREWLDQFHRDRLALVDAERASVDVEAARLAAERRINEQWKSKPTA